MPRLSDLFGFQMPAGAAKTALELNYAISGLPASPVLGMKLIITDGDADLAWGAEAVNSGAGATKYLVWWNGTKWTVLGK